VARELLVRTSFSTNFIAHALACLRVLPSLGYECGALGGYDLAELLEREFRCRPPLAGGPLFTLFFQIPAYFEGDALGDVLDAYGVVVDCVRSRSFDPLRSALGEVVDEWFPEEVEEEFFRELAAYDESRLVGAIGRFKDTLAGAFEDYRSRRWGEALERIRRVEEAVEEALGGVDVIGRWEELLGVDFPFNRFVALLCEPCGTVSSLLVEKIVVPSRASVENLLNAVVHEAGVHFFTPRRLLRHPALRKRYLRDRLGTLRAVEALVSYLKAEILSSMGVSLEADVFVEGMGLRREVELVKELDEEGALKNPYDAILHVLKKSRDNA